ncbi:hypothetical protein AVEN_154757-1 [Araneus ventricosus]|uniref:CCHC-type domain-containing protein n=1 Tax=Araneus ventricosus TaxID=182803 RepID=A0A4Y2BUC5_ARAVE|nr:hypothetical protein AVEN_154757-1 [Araneus ventricosus]
MAAFPWWAVPSHLNPCSYRMGPKTNRPFSGQRKEQNQSLEKYFDNFFIFKRVSENKETFQSVSPFLVKKAVVGTLGEVTSVRKLCSGDLLIEVKSRKQAQQIIKLEPLATIPVTVSAHTSLNSSKGVITCGELFNVSIEEITDEFKGEGVTHVRRIFIRRAGQLLLTKHLILTFQTPTLPDSVKAGYIKLAVRPFIPNPLRCFKCQRFGHSQTNCRGNCARCAEQGHISQQCTEQEKCVNCSGDHTSFSRFCPRWKQEKEIKAVKTKEQISYPEAKRKLLVQTPKSGFSP